MKSKKLAAFLISIGLVFPSVTGCSLFSRKTNKNSSSVESSVVDGSDNSSEQDNSDLSGEVSYETEDSDGIPVYNGDTDTEIGEIENVPVDEFSQEAKDAILRMATLLNSENPQGTYEAFVKYMLELRIGNEAAICFANALSTVYTTLPTGHVESSSESTEVIKAAYYDLLKVLNSLDFSVFCDLLDAINAEYKADAERNYENHMSFAEYIHASLGNFEYYDYLSLKKARDETGCQDQIVLDFLDAYEYGMDNYYYTQADMNRYNNYLDSLHAEMDKDFIPTEIISFIRNHASDSKEMLIKDCKLIVDAYVVVIPEMLELVSNNAQYTEPTCLYDYDSGHTYYEDGYQPQSQRGIIVDEMMLLLEHKDLYIGLFNSIVSDAKLGDLLLDAAVEMLIPIYKNYSNPDNEKLAKVNALENTLKSLSGEQIKSLLRFILKVINLVQDDDLRTLINIYADAMTDGMTQTTLDTLYSLGDKYSPLVADLIDNLSAQESSDILEVGKIIKVDILSEIKRLLSIYDSRDLSTEAGAQAFYDAVGEWAESISERAMDNLLFMFGGSGKAQPSPNPDSEPENNNQPLAFSFVGNGLIGQQYDENNIYVYSYYGSSYISWCTVAEWNSTVQEAKQFLTEYEEMSGEQKADYYYDYERYSIIATMEITNFACSIDTSKCGYIPGVITYTYQGYDYIYRTHLDITVPGINNIRKIDLSSYAKSSDNVFSGYGKYNVTIVYKGSEISFTHTVRVEVPGEDYYDYEERTETVNTNKEGWNIFICEDNEPGKYCLAVYYVVDKAKLNNYLVETHSSTGYLLEGSTYFYGSAYYYASYSCDDGDIRWSLSKYFGEIPQSELSNKPTNTLLTYVDPDSGVSINYVIFDESARVSSSYTFYIGMGNYNFDSDWTESQIYAYNTSGGIPIHAYLYEIYSYTTADGITHNVSFSRQIMGAGATNLNYQHGIFTFEFGGQQFSFVINPNAN